MTAGGLGPGPSRAGPASGGAAKLQDGQREPVGLVADLVDTLDVMVDQPLVGVALFGDGLPAVGRYTIERRLGAGATAVVYAARDTTLDRPVALKIVARRDADGAWAARVHDEARALARLSHPNVVAVHDIGEWRGHPFIAMERVDGVTLARWQADERRAWPETLRRYLAAGRGLEAAHSVGLVHRDFKPANVLVADSGRVLVTDFGLATHFEPAAPRVAAGSRPGVGTPAYLAPEQRAGEAPQPSADVYSFAVALCEALAGRHPALASGLDWRMELRRIGLPRHACAAIVRGMALEPERRWPTMGPLLTALDAALSAARRRRAAGAALVLGLGVAAGVAGVAGEVRPEPPAAPPRPYVAIDRGLLADDPTIAAGLLREVPPAHRGDEWSAAARAVLMRPIARELHCQGGLPGATASIARGLLTAVDARGHAIVCDLATDRATPLAEDAICARVLDGDHVGVLAADGGLAVYERRGGWALQQRIPAAPPAGTPGGTARCERDLAIVGPHAIALRRGGSAWQVVDLASGSPVGAIDTGDARRTLVALSRDRRRALLLDPRGDVVIAPAAEPGGARAQLVALARIAAGDPGRGLAVTLGGTTGTVIDIERGAVLRHDRIPLDGAATALEIAPDGRTAVAATVHGALVWWPLTGDARAAWRESVSDTSIHQIAFNPAGTRLAWRDGFGGIGVRDVGAASSHELPVGGRAICHVGFAAADRVVAVSCEGHLLAWDLAEERAFVAGRHDLAHCRPGCDASAKEIWSVSVDAGGSVAATAGNDGTVGVWALGRGAAGGASSRLSFGSMDRVFTTQFVGDRLLVGGRAAAAQLWDWRSGARLAELPGHATWVYAFAVARPERGPITVVSGDKSGTLRFWDVDGGGLRLRASTAVSAVGTRVNDLAVSPGGRLVAAALDTGEVAVCDAATGELRAKVPAHRGWTRRVLFLDEASLLSAGDDGAVQRIAIASNEVTSSIHAHDAAVFDMDRHGDSLLTAAVDGKIRLFDLRTGARVRTYVGHEPFVGVVRWHPAGDRFVSGGRDGRACVWKVEQDTCHGWLIGHGRNSEVRAAQFVGEDRVLTAAHDGTVRVWTPLASTTLEGLSAELDRRAPACLGESQRRSYLGESPADAAARALACRAAAR